MNIKQMLDFEDLEISLQKQIIDICGDDLYNLDPKTWNDPENIDTN